MRLWQSLYTLNSYQNPTCRGLEEHVLATFSQQCTSDWKPHGSLSPGRAILRCPLRRPGEQPAVVMRTIYEQLELGSFEKVLPAVELYFQKRAGYQTNRHVLTPDLRAEIAHRWKPYFERYRYEASNGTMRDKR